MIAELRRALERFDAGGFCRRHGGRKESRNRHSSEYLFVCPACRGKLRWNVGKGAWLCWSCHLHGDTLALVELLDRTDRAGAVALVLDGYVGGDARTTLTEVAQVALVAPETLRLRRLPSMALPPSVPVQQHPGVHRYLRARGISDQMVHEWGLVAGIRGREESRVIFPVRMDGAVVFWQARAAWDPPPGTSEQRRAWIQATGYRKTLNPMNEEGSQAATAGEVLFNFDRARREPHVVVVEGPVDCVKVGAHAVGLFGKGTPTKILRLRQMGASKYTLYLDRGPQEWARAREIAVALSGYAPTFLCQPPEGHDAGSLTPEQNRVVIDGAIAFERIGLSSGLKV